MRFAQHGQPCVHANNMPVTSLCLRPQTNKCTRFNRPMHRKRSVTAYPYEQYTRKPYSDSQPCQLSEVAKGVNAAREIVAIQVPECVKHEQTCMHANDIPTTYLCCFLPHSLRHPNHTRFNQSMHRVRSVTAYPYEQYSRKPSSDSQIS